MGSVYRAVRWGLFLEIYIMSTLREQLFGLAKDGKGSFKTIHDRIVVVKHFADHLRNDLNIQIKNVDQITSRHIEAYIQHRLDEGISQRTLLNEMSAIRSVLKKAGRSKLWESERLSNASLGLSGASRIGNKEPISEARFREFHHMALGRDKGVAAALELSFCLGLRAEEAVQSNKSLATWVKQIEAGRDRVTIIFGTKGARPRETTLVDRDRTLQAVKTALGVSKENGGKLIDRPDLKSAMDRFHNEVRAIGMVGKESLHSLRYRYAHDALAYYREQGYSEKEARALVSCDLGHGDGRGRYVASVYGMDGAILLQNPYPENDEADVLSGGGDSVDD